MKTGMANGTVGSWDARAKQEIVKNFLRRDMIRKVWKLEEATQYGFQDGYVDIHHFVINQLGYKFSSGYHGHFRNKSRNDFVCEYRQLSKPQPPERFFNRAKETASMHVFSKHDNRQCFLNDALLFEQGLGRKRVPNQTYQFKQDFISWMPEREYIARSNPLTSSYKSDFLNKDERSTQILVKIPKTSFDGVPTSTYRYAHGGFNPNRDTINAMSNEAINLGLLHRKKRAMTAKSHHARESVASCLTWHSSDDHDVPVIKPTIVATKKQHVPPATAVYVPEALKSTAQSSQSKESLQSPLSIQAPPHQPSEAALACHTAASLPPPQSFPPPSQVNYTPVENYPPPRPKTAYNFKQSDFQTSPVIGIQYSPERRLSLDTHAANKVGNSTYSVASPTKYMSANLQFSSRVSSSPPHPQPDIVWLPPRQMVQCAK